MPQGRPKGSKSKPREGAPHLPQDLFKVSLELNGKVYTEKAPSVLEALENIKLDSLLIKTRGIVKVEKDGKITEYFLNPFQIRHLFSKNSFKQIVTKYLMHRLNANA